MPYPAVALILALSAGTSAWGSGDAAKGKAIAERWCSSCHAVSDGQAGVSSDAPAFAAIASRPQAEIDALISFLADPHPPMPNLSLTREEIRDILAYISSLRH